MSTPGTSSAVPKPPEPMPTATVAPIRPVRLWAFGLLGALLAGLVAFAVVEAVPTPFKPPENMVQVPSVPTLQNVPKEGDKRLADLRNAIYAFGVFGAALALSLGLAGGLARGSARSGLVGALAGLVLGAAVGAGVGAGAEIFYQRQSGQDADSMSKDLVLPLLIHAGLWGGIGLAGGAALAIGAGVRSRLLSAALAGLIGGALGAGIYEVTAALISPEGRTFQPIALAWPPRLLAATACPLLVAAVAVSALGTSARRPKRV